MCDNILFSKDLYIVNVNRKKKDFNNINIHENKESRESSEKDQGIVGNMVEEKTEKNREIQFHSNDPTSSLKNDKSQNKNLEQMPSNDNVLEVESDEVQELDESYFIEQSKDKKDSALKKICDIITQPVSFYFL